MSFAEAVANSVVGIILNIAITYTVLPVLFNLHPTLTQAVHITGLYVGLSLLRSHAIRRAFNRHRRDRNRQ